MLLQILLKSLKKTKVRLEMFYFIYSLLWIILLLLDLRFTSNFPAKQKSFALVKMTNLLRIIVLILIFVQHVRGSLVRCQDFLAKWYKRHFWYERQWIVSLIFAQALIEKIISIQICQWGIKSLSFILRSMSKVRFHSF